MKESDFSQFDDPRVREVFAAAANLLEVLNNNMLTNYERIKANELNIALFAAQHSKPRREPPCPPCLLVDEADARAHSKPGSDVAIRVISDPSMPPGKFSLVNAPGKDGWRYIGYGYLQAPEHELPKEPEMKIGSVSFNGNDDGSMTIVVPAGCELKCAQCGEVHVSRAAQSQRKENDE
jgi:hypothetical protein